MSIVSILLVTAGALALVAFAYVTGTESLLSALTRITWWQFVLGCAVYGAGVIADTLGWQYTLGRDRAPRFLSLMAAKCAGEAVNVVTALGSIGGEATKAGCYGETCLMKEPSLRWWSPRPPWSSRKPCSPLSGS